MSNVVEVQPLDNYWIWLRFSDGTQGEVDLSDLAARGVFAAWNDTNVFKEVHVEAGGGIEWPGEIDSCAEPNLRPEEAAELNRRWTDHVQRPESAIPWEEVRRKLRDRE